MRKIIFVGILVLALMVSMAPASAVSNNSPKRVFVQIDGPITDEVLAELKANGMNVLYIFNEIRFVAGIAKDKDLKRISKLKFVKSVGKDVQVNVTSEELPSMR